MKALVLYRSDLGNTKQLADEMAKERCVQGIESVVQDLRRELPDLRGFDFIPIGSPTRMARVNRKARRGLKRLRKKGFTERPIAVFDTYGPVPTYPEELEKGKKWLYPGAAGILHRIAETQRLNVYSKALRCEVMGMKGPLNDNELEKAADFARKFVSTIGERPDKIH